MLLKLLNVVGGLNKVTMKAEQETVLVRRINVVGRHPGSSLPRWKTN